MLVVLRDVHAERSELRLVRRSEPHCSVLRLQPRLRADRRDQPVLAVHADRVRQPALRAVHEFRDVRDLHRLAEPAVLARAEQRLLVPVRLLRQRRRRVSALRSAVRGVRDYCKHLLELHGSEPPDTAVRLSTRLPGEHADGRLHADSVPLRELRAVFLGHGLCFVHRHVRAAVLARRCEPVPVPDGLLRRPRASGLPVLSSPVRDLP